MSPSKTSTPAPTRSRDQVFQTLVWLKKHNLKAVPLEFQSKAAINRQYIEPAYVPPGEDLWQSKNLGIGVVTGDVPNGSLVDTDCDSDETVFLARRLLPPTQAVFGRKSKRGSHFLYLVSAPLIPKKAFMDPRATTDATIIEIRASGGHQTMLPGSIHPDGEPIEWDSVPFPDLTTVDYDVLYKSICKLAIATLIIRYVWIDGQRNEVCKHLSGMFYYMDWTEEDTASIIQAVTDYLQDDDKTRRLTVKNTYAKAGRGGKITGATSLRKFLGEDKIVDRILDWAGSPTVNILQEYNEKYATILLGSKFRIAYTDVLPGEPINFLTRDDFASWTMSDVVTIDDKHVSKSKIWLSNPRHRSYNKVDFLPGMDEPPPGILNSWTGWPIRPSETASCSAWKELLYEIICGRSDDLYKWMINWFANIVREPMNKSQTSPVIIGDQGAGKSLLFNYFGVILGDGYVSVTNESHIYGQFNSHLASALLLHSEEALYGGDKKHRGIIKSLITDRSRISEQKFGDAYKVGNYLRLALTSNEEHAAPVEVKDRRFTTIHTQNRMLDDRLKRAVLREMNETGGPSGLFHHLIAMDYDPELPRVNVKDSSLHLMKAINYGPIEAWWYDALSLGQVLPDVLAWATRPAKEDWPEMVSSAALYLAMTMHAHGQGKRSVPSSVVLARTLDQMTGCSLQRVQRLFDNPHTLEATVPQGVRGLSSRQSAIVNMPTLKECRVAFERHIGQPVAWIGDMPDEDKGAWEKSRKEEDRF